MPDFASIHGWMTRAAMPEGTCPGLDDEYANCSSEALVKHAEMIEVSMETNFVYPHLRLHHSYQPKLLPRHLATERQ
jgi:hypothetical protein